MSDTKKDERRGGGHRDWSCKEFWSRRCKRVNGARMGPFGKRVTHRFERRQAKRELLGGE